MARPRCPRSARATILDLLETYCGEWWSLERIVFEASQRHSPDAVRRAFWRLKQRPEMGLVFRNADGMVRAMIPNRYYMEESA